MPSELPKSKLGILGWIFEKNLEYSALVHGLVSPTSELLLAFEFLLARTGFSHRQATKLAFCTVRETVIVVTTRLILFHWIKNMKTKLSDSIRFRESVIATFNLYVVERSVHSTPIETSEFTAIGEYPSV